MENYYEIIVMVLCAGSGYCLGRAHECWIRMNDALARLKQLTDKQGK